MATQNNLAYSHIQKNLFEKIKHLIPPTHNIADELADLLCISIDSSYRRLRGETLLNLNEIAVICDKYKISFDNYLNRDTGMVSFNYKPLTADEDSFLMYLTNIKENLKRIQLQGNGEVFYAAEDIPLFHLFSQSHLAAFKCFYWMKSVLGYKSFENKKFDAALVRPEFLETGKEIMQLYSVIPSTEIWSEITVNSLIKQIEYYYEARLFKKPADAILICDQFIDLLKYLRKQAEYGCKYVSEAPMPHHQQNFNLYNCEVEIGNNCILVDLGNIKSVYLTHHTMNTLQTNNNAFCEETALWFRNLLGKSVLLSGVAEKQRFRFFEKSIAIVEQLRERVSA